MYTHTVCEVLFLSQQLQTYIISSFHHEVDENCALLGYYAAICDNPLLATIKPRRVQFSITNMAEV
jgi:hypothetical protein